MINLHCAPASPSPLFVFLFFSKQDSISSPPLQEFLDVISPEEERLYKLLIDLGQTHIFDSWPATGTDDDKKRNFFEQVRTLSYIYVLN